jgi:hypothetical protein
MNVMERPADPTLQAVDSVVEALNSGLEGRGVDGRVIHGARFVIDPLLTRPEFEAQGVGATLERLANGQSVTSGQFLGAVTVMGTLRNQRIGR